MPQTADEPDAVAVRTWCALALDALGREREAIDAINVYPVADGDTGTNLYLTVESAAAAVEAVFAAHETGTSVPSAADAVRAMAHGALIGARGNSGTILAQLLRGMAGVLAEGTGGDRMRLALDRAAAWARDAVAHPVEGTVLTVADRAAAAAGRAAPGADTAEVARAAYEGARTALDATPDSSPPSPGPGSSTRAGADWSPCSAPWSRPSPDGPGAALRGRPVRPAARRRRGVPGS